MFGGKGEQALRVAEQLTESWAAYQRGIERWKSEVLDSIVGTRAELSEARSKQRDHARTVQGQVEAINERLNGLTMSNTETVEREVLELRDQVNILRESVKDIAKDGNETSQDLHRLVDRLSGAVTPKGVFVDRAPH